MYFRTSPADRQFHSTEDKQQLTEGKKENSQFSMKQPPLMLPLLLAADVMLVVLRRCISFSTCRQLRWYIKFTPEDTVKPLLL